MSRFWSDHVVGLMPYVAGEQPKVPNLLKLNTNENPYGPSPRALQAIHDAANGNLKLYPDNESTALRQAIARHHGLMPDQVFVGNGSDDVLAHIFNALFRHGLRPLCMPDITYSFYATYCLLFDIPVHIIPLDDNLNIRAADYTGYKGPTPGGIIFANPNAPTGQVLPLADIAAIAAAHPDTPVVVDEAYVDFGAETATGLIAQHPNIVTVHTFSKSRSLAGMRVGFAMSSPEIIQGLNRVKDSFNSYPLDTLAQAAAVAAMEDTGYFEQTRRTIMQTRDQLAQQLAGLGFQVLPSSTNFLFVRHPLHDGAALAQALRSRNVLVRRLSHPRIQQYLRISVGTPQECERLLQAVSESLPHVAAPAA